MKMQDVNHFLKSYLYKMVATNHIDVYAKKNYQFLFLQSFNCWMKPPIRHKGNHREYKDSERI